MSADAASVEGRCGDGRCRARRRRSAVALVQASLDRIDGHFDGRVNAFTVVVRERALRRAAQVDASLASAKDTRTRELPLLGVPFAVKNLFDIAGLPTLAGSKIERDRHAARSDAALVRRLESAGAVLVGALNMDEYAYGFTTENSHVGPRPQPARPDPHRGRLVGRFGRRGRRWPGAAHAGLRHQRLDPRARLAVRRVRAQAHLQAAAAHRQLPVRLQPRPPGAVRAFGARPGPGLRRDAGPRGPRPARPRLRAAGGRAALARCWRWARRACASACSAATSASSAQPEALSAVDARGAGARAPATRSSVPMVEAGRAAAFLDHQRRRRGAAPARPAPPRAGLRAVVARPLPGRRADSGRLGGARSGCGGSMPSRPRECSSSFDVLLAAVDALARRRPSVPNCSRSTASALPVRPTMGVLTQPISCIGLPVCAVPVWGAPRPTCRSACR